MTEMNGTNEKEDGVERCMLNSEHLQNTGCRNEIGGPSQQASLNTSNIGYSVAVGHVREVRQAAAEDAKSSATALEYWNTAVVLNIHLVNIATMEVALEDVVAGENMQVVS